jgi:hypothetical protein
MRSKHVLITAAIGVIALVVPLVAFGATKGGNVDRVLVRSGRNFETSSDAWTRVATVNVEVAGPLTTFSLSGAGYAIDYGAGGRFKGEKYAEMKIRLKVGPKTLAPGAMAFASNAGVQKSKKPRMTGNTLEWFYDGSGSIEVKIQAKGRKLSDISGLKSWIFSALHEEPI